MVDGPVKIMKKALADAGGFELSDQEYYKDAEISFAALEAAGYAVVPVEATEGMLDAGWPLYGGGPSLYSKVWKNMLAAAPKWGDGDG